MKDVAKAAVQDCGGLTQVTFDQIAARVISHGRDAVPPALKEEMMEQLRQAIRQRKDDNRQFEAVNLTI